MMIGNWSACISRIIVPLNMQLRNSSNEWRDNVATCGLLQRPPLSTSSSNLTHLEMKKFLFDLICFFWRNRIYLAVSFQPCSIESPDSFNLSPSHINSSSSINKSCGLCSSSSSSWSSSPNKNCIRALGLSKHHSSIN